MPTPTYDLLASNVLSSGASNIEFTSIPSTYRDLVIVMTVTADSASFGRMRFNNDSGSNYNLVFARGDGANLQSVAISDDNEHRLSIGSGYSSTEPSSHIIQIMDYSTTDKHKTHLLRWNLASAQVVMIAGRWANTSAITEIDIYPTSGNFTSGSSFYLYGIAS